MLAVSQLARSCAGPDFCMHIPVMALDCASPGQEYVPKLSSDS